MITKNKNKQTQEYKYKYKLNMIDIKHRRGNETQIKQIKYKRRDIKHKELISNLR